ncbi:anosmin-1 [Anabrus simplex]|uniref:anosmin-1 n=1 Tax=Anabrus simplex TaxID=316456 RepID=UPI0035A2C334
MSALAHTVLAVLLVHAAATVVGAHAAATYQLQQYDSLRVARCVAQCWTAPPENKEMCENTCLQSHYSKPGSCPSGSYLSVFDVACIKACSADSECSGTLKCCTHSCGVTCQRAQGLESIADLPAIPENVTVSERRHGRAVQLEWDEPGDRGVENEPPLLYLLEERHHVGRHLTPERFGSWITRHRSTRTSATLKNILKPGRWYQFRVAAVNANGSRGFSEPSAAFKLSLAPKVPGPPLNLTVGPLSKTNGTFRGVLSWMPPVSDLPIQRYKVFWSRRLQGTSSSQASVLVHHQTVAGEVLRFVLKSLEPESLYFLQVQAMAQFGRERLKSEKAAMFLNTSNHANTPEIPAPRRPVRELQDFRIQELSWTQGQLTAKLVWHPPPRRTRSRYVISWRNISCDGDHPITHTAITNKIGSLVYPAVSRFGLVEIQE